jgi:hypothetical protein
VDPALASTDQPYAYAYNNPVNGSDPTGLFSPCDVPWIGPAACARAGELLRPLLEQAVVSLNSTLTGSAQTGFVAGVAQADVDFANQVVGLPPSVKEHLGLLRYYLQHPELGWPIIQQLFLPSYAQILAQLNPVVMVTQGARTVWDLAQQARQAASCHTLGYNLGYALTTFILQVAVVRLTAGAGDALVAALRGAELDAATVNLESAVAKGDTAAAAQDEQAVETLTCGCFPGDAKVATPHGLVAIASIHVGEQVLAEDPKTHKVEPERVQAVIDDGIKPLMSVSLSDGSNLSVTTNHPFHVDSGPGITTPTWVQAGDLKVGDRLRTKSGKDVTVTALGYHTGYAHVYTLTVANDHDFFVGHTGVLVHNARRGPCPKDALTGRGGSHNNLIADRIQELLSQGYIHIAGGTKTEEVIQITVSDSFKPKRRLDITMIAPDGSIHREQVGRTYATGMPVNREIEGIRSGGGSLTGVRADRL